MSLLGVLGALVGTFVIVARPRTIRAASAILLVGLFVVEQVRHGTAGPVLGWLVMQIRGNDLLAIARSVLHVIEVKTTGRTS